MRSSSRHPHAGTHNMSIPPHSDTKSRKAYESRREREFYSYVESVLDTPPLLCDLNDPASVAAHRPRSASDKALTAFVQLTALRLRSRRSLLFFFDSEFAYILAEATRTLSLVDDSQHEIDDSLWLGASKIPRGFSVCEVTADLPVNHGSNSKDPKSKTIAHIINDLSEDTRFCSRPYVNGGPFARFYAGVPVTTPHGYNIGALCVLDDRPRDGLDELETRFLCDMATTVMTHLSMVRANTENQRSRAMTTALGAFIEGKSSRQDWEHRTAHHTSRNSTHEAVNSARAHARRTRPSPRKSRRSSREYSERATSTSDETSLPDRTTKSPPRRPDFDLTSSDQTTSLDIPNETKLLETAAHLAQQKVDTTDFAAQSDVIDSSKSIQEDKFATKVRAIMTRAACLMRDAVDVDGVLFLDATIGSYQGAVSSLQALNETDSAMTDTTGDQVPGQESESGSMSSTPRRGCPVLGFAAGPDGEDDSTPSPPSSISESFLRSLLRRYPDGRVWHFNEDGDASEDELPEMPLSNGSDTNGSETETATSTPADRRSQRRLHTRVKDGRMIRRFFPGVRSLMLVGMWDSHAERWWGASLVWSYNPIRIMRASTDLSFLAAFCDVILAEIWRVEALMVDRSKNDFISSISHELRSPLHGILGSAECLEDRESDAVSQELIRSVISCGTTLLEIINQLLQYSKLDNGAQARHSQLRKFGNMLGAPNGSTVDEEMSDLVAPETGMLSSLTEEAVNTACAGFEHQGMTPYGGKSASASRSEKHNPERGPTVIIDIDHALNPDWTFRVRNGSWKRIVMNLVSNSLKYTVSGHITITLRKHWLSRLADERPAAEITLVVSDTGIGMSETFQKQNLFRPFRQENSLAQGTGLGLNLVAKLARSEGGKVIVKSTKGEGTTVTFTLQMSPATNGATVSQDYVHRYDGVKVGMIGFAQLDGSDFMYSQLGFAQRKLAEVLGTNCTELGMALITPNDGATGDLSLQLVHDLEFKRFNKSSDAKRVQKLLSTPSVVICATRASALRLRKELKSLHADKTQFVWQPVGPAKLADAIKACCSPRGSHSSTTRHFGPVEDASELTDDMMAGAALHTANLALRSKSDDAEIPMTRSLLEDARTNVQQSKSAESPATRSLSLLLVDDNHVNLRLLTVFAKKAGYPYCTAQDGEEAVSVYKRFASDAATLHLADHPEATTNSKPDVVLMDLNMPVMDGFAATRQIRLFEKEAGVRRAKIIALTGLGNKQAQDRSFASGIDLFLTKPVKLKELGALLDKLGENDNDDTSADNTK